MKGQTNQLLSNDIIHCLEDYKGFSWWWDGIEDEDKAAILAELDAIVANWVDTYQDE